MYLSQFSTAVTNPTCLSFCQNIAHSTLGPLAPRIAKDLGPFLLITSEDTLSLVLEALSVVVEIEGDWMTPQLAGDLVTAVLDVWTKNVKGISPGFCRVGVFAYPSSFLDPIFISLISEVLENLAQSPSPGVYEALVKAALPALCQAFGASGSNSSWIASSALDLLTGIVRGVNNEKGLGEGFFAAVASPLFKCLREAEDRDVLQVEATCLEFSLVSHPCY
jgi:importin-9